MEVQLLANIVYNQNGPEPRIKHFIPQYIKGVLISMRQTP